LDVVSWLTIYRVVGWFRYDAFYATPFQFFVINFIQLGVIVTALYFVGGYDRTCRETKPGLRGRTHPCGHSAALVSAMLVYSAATFDQDDEAQPRCVAFELCDFSPRVAGVSPMDSPIRGREQRWPLFSSYWGRRDSGAFLRGLQKASNGQQLEFVAVNEEHVANRSPVRDLRSCRAISPRN
jgi:hypothetical protein